MAEAGGPEGSPAARHFFFSGSKVTTTYFVAWSPRDFTASAFLSFSEADLKVTFWVPSFSPASMVMDFESTPSSFANASRTCVLQPPQVTPVMPTA